MGRWCQAQNLFKGLWDRCNRDEWMRLMRRMGSAHASSRGIKSSSSARLAQPLGKCLAGRSEALRRLPIAEFIGCTPPCASHGTPKKILNRFSHIGPHAQQVVVRARQGNHRRISFAHALAQLEQGHVHVKQQLALLQPTHHAPRRSCRCGARA